MGGKAVIFRAVDGDLNILCIKPAGNPTLLSPPQALCLLVPKMRELSEQFRPTDPEALHRARRSVILDIAAALKSEMISLFDELMAHKDGCYGQKQLGIRALRNELLVYLSESRDEEAADRAYKYFCEAECMTDKYHALIALGSMDQPERGLAFKRFYEDARGELLSGNTQPGVWSFRSLRKN